MEIVVKEIDQLRSIKHKNRKITEYIIYLMVGPTIIEAHTEIGDDNKNRKLKELEAQISYGTTI
jgi:hypothetical protein